MPALRKPIPQRVLREIAKALEDEAKTYYDSFTVRTTMEKDSPRVWTDDNARRAHKQYTRLAKTIREQIW